MQTTQHTQAAQPTFPNTQQAQTHNQCFQLFAPPPHIHPPTPLPGFIPLSLYLYPAAERPLKLSPASYGDPALYIDTTKSPPNNVGKTPHSRRSRDPRLAGRDANSRESIDAGEIVERNKLDRPVEQVAGDGLGQSNVQLSQHAQETDNTFSKVMRSKKNTSSEQVTEVLLHQGSPSTSANDKVKCKTAHWRRCYKNAKFH